MNRFLNCAVLTVFGALATLAYAPYNLLLAGFLSLIFFVAIVSGKSNTKTIFTYALSYGLGFFGGGVSWVYVSIHTYGYVPAPLAVLFTAGFVALLATFFALPWLFLSQVRNKSIKLYICVPLLWFLGEWLRGFVFTGFPWLHLGYSLVDTPLAGWIPILGVLGTGTIYIGLICTLIALSNGLSRSKLLTTMAVYLLVIAGGQTLRSVDWTQNMGEPIDVALVQPNLGIEERWQRAERENILAKLEHLSMDHWNDKLVVWPEAAMPLLGQQAEDYLTEQSEQLESTGSAWITGLITYHSEQFLSETRPGINPVFHNSIAGLGEARGIYHKQRLVPFGEYVPWSEQLRGLMKFFDLPMSMLKPGSEQQTLLTYTHHLDQILIAPAICYEIAYSDLVKELSKEAQMLVTLSNDGWFGASIGPWQHLQIAQARAIETGKPILRSTNNGVSAIINEKGVVTHTIPQFKAGVLVGEITPRSGRTPFTYIKQYWLTLFAIGVLVMVRRSFRSIPLKQVLNSA